VTNARTAKSTREKAAELRAEAERGQRRRRRSTMVVATVVALLAVVVVSGVAVQLVRTARNQAMGSAPHNLFDGGIMVGRANAPVTVTLFEDFQCPICKQFEAESGKTLAGFVANGTVKIMYRPVAFLNEQSTTDYSTRALDAAGAVVDLAPTKFQAFHDLLFANQPPEGSAGLTDARLAELAGQAGAPADKVAAALKAKQFAGWAASITELANMGGVNGTPTIKVGDTTLTNNSLASLTTEIRKAMALQAQN
jgi:protein-disulfide isomerase